jgi:hypothetical protein
MPLPRILVTGSRDWTDVETIAGALEAAWLELRDRGNPVLVTGTARGADQIAERIWTTRVGGVHIERHPADWRTLGRAAGPARNRKMVEAGADICLAFIKNESTGATMTANLAARAGIPTRWFLADAQG